MYLRAGRLFRKRRGRIAVSGRAQPWRGGAFPAAQNAPCTASGRAKRRRKSAPAGIRACCPVEQPRCGTQNGLGAQPLYDLVLRLYEDGQLLEERHLRVGIRSVACVQNDGAPSGARPLCVRGERQADVRQGREYNAARPHLRRCAARAGVRDTAQGERDALQYGARVGRRPDRDRGVLRLLRCARPAGLAGIHPVSSGIDNIPSEKPEFLGLFEAERGSGRAAEAEPRVPRGVEQRQRADGGRPHALH